MPGSPLADALFWWCLGNARAIGLSELIEAGDDAPCPADVQADAPIGRRRKGWMRRFAQEAADEASEGTLDDRTVRSCLVLAVEADGHEITTVEGLNYEGLSELQDLMIGNNSFQCGFCAPGIVLAATELLENNPSPTRHDVQEALAGNLCRCTGYEPIIEAVLSAGTGGDS